VSTRLPHPSIIPLASIPNLRDVGGLAARDGARVRVGLLYRSMALGRATEPDLATLADLRVSTVFDLRTAMEREREPDRLPRGAELVPLDVLADSGEADPAAVFALMGDPPRMSKALADGGTERFYLASYRDMVRLPSARESFGRLYRSLASDRTGAALVHCTTGKDRTGWAVAALLLLLGVRADVVMRDYLVSDAAVRAAFAPMMKDFVARGGSRDVIEPLMSVRPSYLDAAIDLMHEAHGSIDAYFRDGLGLADAELVALRSRFLRPG
jgi:protein-tyrosine phosphatase